MTSDDIRLLGIEGHVDTLNFIAGLIVDFSKINGYDPEDIIPVISRAVDAVKYGWPLDACTLRGD